MRRGAGLEEPNDAGHTVGDALDQFVGGWSEQDAQEFLAEISVFEEIDPELWR